MGQYGEYGAAEGSGKRALAGAAGVAAGYAIAQGLLGSRAVRFARMSGSSIAAPDAAGWVTDFLNAAYYRRPRDRRQVDDLRLAYAIVATQWYRNGGRRLHAVDVLSLHRAFGRARFLDATRAPRGALCRAQLLEGAARLHGAWFPDAYADDARRGWGIAFPTAAERTAYRPALRLRHAALGPLTPPVASDHARTWHTYEPVPAASAERLIAGFLSPETWPDYASELGRFTPLRPGGLLGQTFEIEVVALVTPGTPILTRGYVTATRLASAEQPDGLAAYVAELNDGLARCGRDEPPAVPRGATPLLAVDLTAHAGHFLGRARSKLVVYTYEGQAYVRDTGVWDPMEWYIAGSYRAAGAYAQRAFWGMESPEESMPHQMALGAA